MQDQTRPTPAPSDAVNGAEMTPERWRRVEAVFAQAHDAPAGERTAIARALAGDDEALADEVLSLLRAAERSPDYLDRLAARLSLADVQARPPCDSSGRMVGPYRLMRLLGHGGMGSVYLAQRADGVFDQTVAIKLLPLGSLRPDLARRFRAERQILAGMQHPNIARLLDGGVTEDGTPYFVMEHVDGLALDAWCEQQALPIEHRLRLFLDVCGAVEAAHRNLVIHRDLKPANVMVTAEGSVKLLDFGIARLLSSDDGATGPQPLSPAYASPEQLQGGPLTTAVDVWGLGVILYGLLARRLPFEGRCLTDRTPPPPPSRFRPELPRDLDAIVLKALQPEPEHRYAWVALLADDIRRHLQGQPVRARVQSWGYRLRCFARRHRYGVAAAMTIVALLGALAALSLHSAGHAREQAARIAQERDAAREVTEFLVEVFAAADTAAERGETVTARELLDRGAARVRTELRDRPQIQATLLGTIGRVYRQLGLLDRAAPLLEQALAQRQQLFAAPHPAIAEAMHELGLARWSGGRPKDAQRLLQSALAMRETLHPRPHRDTVTTRIALARLLVDQGHPAQGVRELRAAIRDVRGLGADAKPVEAHARYHLALALHHQGDLKAASYSFREAAALYRRLPLEPTPESAESLLMLAHLESVRGPHSEVEALYAEALSAYRKLHGVDHPDYAEALRLSANQIAKRDDGLARAEAQLQQALRIHAQLREPDRAGLANTLIDLASVRLRRGDPNDAERILARALAIGRELAEPVTLAIAQMASSELQIARGDLPAAAQALDEAEKLFADALGPDSPMLLRVALRQGELAHRAGRHAQAQTLLRDTLRRYEAMLGPDHARVADTRLALGTCLFEDGRKAEARPLLLAAEAALRRNEGADAPDTRRVVAMLTTRK